MYLIVNQGYKVGAAKTTEEYAKLDANDESLARWKASLGVVPGTTNEASGPKVCAAASCEEVIIHVSGLSSPF